MMSLLGRIVLQFAGRTNVSNLTCVEARSEEIVAANRGGPEKLPDKRPRRFYGRQLI